MKWNIFRSETDSVPQSPVESSTDNFKNVLLNRQLDELATEVVSLDLQLSALYRELAQRVLVEGKSFSIGFRSLLQLRILCSERL